MSFELSVDKVTLITKDYLTGRIERAYLDQWKVFNKKKVCVSFKHACPVRLILLLFFHCHLLHWIVSLCSVSKLHQGSLQTNQEPRFQADQSSIVWYRWLFTPPRVWRGLQVRLKLMADLLVRSAWMCVHANFPCLSKCVSIYSTRSVCECLNDGFLCQVLWVLRMTTNSVNAIRFTVHLSCSSAVAQTPIHSHAEVCEVFFFFFFLIIWGCPHGRQMALLIFQTDTAFWYLIWWLQCVCMCGFQGWTR